MMTTFPAVPTIAPAVTTRAQLDTLLENIARLRAERDELRAALESDLEAVRIRYRAPFTEIDRYLELETGWAEGWARENPAALDANRSLTCETATLGFRAEPPRIERASRRWNWTRIAYTLGQLDWGKRYLRTTTPEIQVDKDALAADLPSLSPEALRAAGLRIEQGDQFFIETHPAPQPEYQEAA